MSLTHVKAAKYEAQKPSTYRATLFRSKFLSMFPAFHLAWSTCRATKTFVVGWRKLLRKVERGSTEQQILAFLLVFHQTHNLSRNKFARALQIIQSARRISSTCNKCFCCGSSWSSKVKNAKHRPKLAMKQCCATSWGFLFLVFRRLNITTVASLRTLVVPLLFLDMSHSFIIGMTISPLVR